MLRINSCFLLEKGLYVLGSISKPANGANYWSSLNTAFKIQKANKEDQFRYPSADRRSNKQIYLLLELKTVHGGLFLNGTNEKLQGKVFFFKLNLSLPSSHTQVFTVLILLRQINIQKDQQIGSPETMATVDPKTTRSAPLGNSSDVMDRPTKNERRSVFYLPQLGMCIEESIFHCT